MTFALEHHFGSSPHPALPITEPGKFVTRGVGGWPFPSLALEAMRFSIH
jgi:hypothetical protein